MNPTALLRISVLPLLLLLGIITVFTYTKFKAYIKTEQQAEHTGEVIVHLDNLLKYAKDAETNQRGYIITKNYLFLTSYQKALLQIENEILVVDTLLKRSASQYARYNSVIDLLRTRLRIMKEVLDYNSVNQNDAMVDSMQVGKEIMDQLDYEIKKIIDTEQRQLKSMQQQTSSILNFTPMVLLVFSMFSILIVLLGYVFIARELRLRLRTQQELEIKVDDLNRSNRELEQFAYVASHDLQEPLRKIQSFGDRLMIKHGNYLNDDVRTGISKMQASAARMQILIDDLLGYSRVLHLKDEFRETDLNKILDGVLSDLEVSIRNKNARIEVTKSLPVINAVPLQMQQLFLNLISNALKFSKPTSQPIINISCEKVKGNEIPEVKQIHKQTWFYRVGVADNGIGFNAEYSKKIFVIFQQLHNKMEYGGTGIGLAVCKKIAENHGGYITAESVAGKGSTFYVYLPVF